MTILCSDDMPRSLAGASVTKTGKNLTDGLGRVSIAITGFNTCDKIIGIWDFQGQTDHDIKRKLLTIG